MVGLVGLITSTINGALPPPKPLLFTSSQNYQSNQ